MAERFSWVPAFEAIATKLLEYEDRQGELTAIVQRVLGESFTVMDPLTFFSMFNGKMLKYDRRSEAVAIILEELGIVADVPTDFEGVPTTFAQRWRFWNGQPGNIEKNWRVFRSALSFADASSPSAELRNAFVEAYNTAVAQTNVGEPSLTMALFWARPSVYLPLDNNTVVYLRNRYSISKNKLDGAKYLDFIESVRQRINLPFVDLSFAAWEKGGWIPAPSEYDPRIDSKQLAELLQDPSIGKIAPLTALKCLNEHPKGATCTELSEFYGRTAEFYNTNISVLAETVASRLGIPPREVGNGKWWPVLCYGNYVRKRRHGTFEWRLRDEVREALKSIDLGHIPLREAEDVPAPAFDLDRFRRLVALYKKDFHRFRGPDGEEGDREAYKWDDLLAYHEHWNLDAPDLSAMLVAALKPSATGGGSLLDNGFEHPYDRLLKFAAYDPDAFREAFRKLYDPQSSLRVAYAGFSRDMDELLRRHDAEAEVSLDRDYQEPKAASVYLFFEKPDRYYIYKYTFAGSLAEAVGANIPTDQLERFYQYEALCDELLPYALSDTELLDLSDSVLSQEQRDADSARHLMLQDIAYYADRYMKGWNENWETLLSGEEEIVTVRGGLLEDMPTYPKNMILYGPPGTGKTYQTKAYAVAICTGQDVKHVLERMKTDEGYRAVTKRYQELEAEKRIGFTTFHQSYGYEEFIEGIRPIVVTEGAEVESTGGTISYSCVDGVFKRFCQNATNPIVREEAEDFGFNEAPTVWKVSLEGTGDNPTRTECLANGHIRIGWDVYGRDITDETDFGEYGGKNVLNAFITKMRRGDIVLSCYSSTTIDAIGVITGDVEWHDEYDSYKRLRKVRWITTGLKYDIVSKFEIPTLTLSTVYKLKLDASDVVGILDELHLTKRAVTRRGTLPCVFIIDEINRGSVSKVFGELITLLEDNKRRGAREEATVTLPYSGKKFSVPENVYVLGTMNTADRSTALMDTALRRRFSFREVMPEPELFDGVDVEGVNVAEMLRVMNERIELLYDREHALGHAIFMPLKSYSVPSIDLLCELFKEKVIPLLQEYFFDDYSKIRSVLGAAADDFVEVKSASNVFWRGDPEPHEHLVAYRLKPVDKLGADAFRRIYQIERGE